MEKGMTFVLGLALGAFILLGVLYVGGVDLIFPEEVVILTEVTEEPEIEQKSAFGIFEERIASFMPDKVPSGSDIFQLASKLDVLAGQKYGYKLDVSEDGKSSGYERIDLEINGIAIYIFKHRIKGLPTGFITINPQTPDPIKYPTIHDKDFNSMQIGFNIIGKSLDRLNGKSIGDLNKSQIDNLNMYEYALLAMLIDDLEAS
ncbi:hypothetical protein COB64_01320 [Candidatus Wolfebacteria bacterium]|nr:MAG: hypothetical protein COB64_01320 [Candidatus Wolfebacteria bacterium]